VDDDDDGDGADGRHEEHDVEPSMVKVELKLAQHFRDDSAVLEKKKKVQNWSQNSKLSIVKIEFFKIPKFLSLKSFFA